MYSYYKLEQKLNKKKMYISDLTSALGISSRTIARMNKGEKVRDDVLSKIAKYLKCSKEDLFDEVSSNKILQQLRDEKSIKMKGMLYHKLQIVMTYNSNHIEGSKLTQDQTKMIFETRTLFSSDEILVDDIIETSNHFRAIDYIIDTAEEELTEDIIKHIHYILKCNTKDSSISWFNVGDYKQMPNEVGNMKTTNPENVPKEMKKLLEKYNNKKEITFSDIIDFHSQFEHIHPFQDGNGRVGRLIAFKECLKNNIIPFIILDEKKAFYYRGLQNYNKEKGWLLDTCLDGQDEFKKILDEFEINNN